MKVIYPDMITAVLADEQNANFPDDNISDDHPKQVWRATSKDAKLTLTVGGGSDTVAIYNTNARTIVFTLKDSLGATIESATYDLSGIDTYLEFFRDSGDYWEHLWIEYTYQADQHTIELDFTAADTDIVEAGVVRAGLAYEFPEPQYGLSEGLVDYSIRKELNNGSLYYRKRDIARTFSGSVMVERQPYFYRMMKTIARNVGPQPLAWKVIGSATSQEWCVFATLDTMPSGNHQYPIHSVINFSLKEVP